jgi:hypothetical protein
MFYVLGVVFGQVQALCLVTPCETGQLSPAGPRALRDLGISLGSYAAYAVTIRGRLCSRIRRCSGNHPLAAAETP